MTDLEAKQKIQELLKSGELSVQQISNSLMLAARKASYVLNLLRRDGIVIKNSNNTYRLVVPSDSAITPMKLGIVPTKTPKRIKKDTSYNKSIIILRIIFAVLAVGASMVGIRNTSTYLLESYPLFWAFSLSALISLFMVSAASMVVLFWKEKKIPQAMGIGILWVIVTAYSMSATSIGMYNKQKETFKEATHITKVDNTNQMLYTQYEKQEKDIQLLIDNKKLSLIRYNQQIYPLGYGTKEYNNLSYNINNAEIYIAQQTAQLNAISTKKASLLSVIGDTEVPAKNFYEMIEETFGIRASVIQFVLSLFAAIFVDLIAPIGASMALFLKEDRK